VQSVTFKGNIYPEATGDGRTPPTAYTYYASNITGGPGPITVTITLSAPAAGYIEVYAGEYTGVAADPLDRTSFATGTGMVLSSGAATTNYPGEVIWGFCDVANGVSAPDPPFTLRENLNDNFAADLTVAATGSYAVTGTLTLSAAWACHMATFRYAGAPQAITGVGFPARAVLFSSVYAAGPTAHARFGLGAADAAFNQASSALTDQNAANPSSVRGIDKTNRAFMKMDNNTSSIDAEAILSSIEPGGFTLDWTTNDGVATPILYLALGTPTTNHRSIGRDDLIGFPNGYGVGTIEVTQGSPSVTGSGSAWQANNRGRGDVITIPCDNPPTCDNGGNPDGVHYTILGVGADNALRLTQDYLGADDPTSTYLIRRQFASPQDWESCIDGQGGSPPPALPVSISGAEREPGHGRPP
jgi:hypothetical protein